ncbi:MAG: tetratricopeptide repeat protein [Desulfuromonadaceae bacterium]|nr:tetratricopeptide repeat protein [Desulfuromonadaceae bacterium]
MLTPQDIEDKFEQANAAFVRSDFAQAEILCREILAAEPNNFQSLLMIANIAQYAGNFQESINILTHIRTIYTINNSAISARVLFDLGNALLFIGKPDQALSHYKEAAELDENHYFILFAGIASWLSGCETDAEGYFKRHAEITGDEDGWLRSLVSALSAVGRIEEADSLYLPFVKKCVSGSQPRKQFYDYDRITASDDITLQSERYGFDNALLDATIKYISRILDLKPEDTLLDIGGAGGLISAKLAGEVKHLTMVELHPVLVEKAGKNLSGFSNVDVLQDDALKLDNVSACYDKILMYGVSQLLPSVSDLRRALVNIFDKLSPGGKALIGYNVSIENMEDEVTHALHDQVYHGFAEFNRKLLVMGMLENALRLDEGEFTSMAREAGFQTVELFENSYKPEHIKSRLIDLLVSKGK